MESDDDSGDEAEEKPKKKKPKKGKQKKKTKKTSSPKTNAKKEKKKETVKEKAKPAAAKKVSEPTEGGEGYQAGNYAKIRLEFIREAVATKIPFREASKLWHTSSERARILAGMSRKELVRRRFVQPSSKASKGA